jgi:hypothetical protein
MPTRKSLNKAYSVRDSGILRSVVSDIPHIFGVIADPISKKALAIEAGRR